MKAIASLLVISSAQRVDGKTNNMQTSNMDLNQAWFIGYLVSKVGDVKQFLPPSTLEALAGNQMPARPARVNQVSIIHYGDSLNR